MVATAALDMGNGLMDCAVGRFLMDCDFEVSQDAVGGFAALPVLYLWLTGVGWYWDAGDVFYPVAGVVGVEEFCAAVVEVFF